MPCEQPTLIMTEILTGDVYHIVYHILPFCVVPILAYIIQSLCRSLPQCTSIFHLKLFLLFAGVEFYTTLSYEIMFVM